MKITSVATRTPYPQTAAGELYASGTPSLGIEPDWQVLGESVFAYGDAA